MTPTFTLLIDGAPAPPELVGAVEQIEVDRSLEEASAVRVRFGIHKTARGDWSILEDDPFEPLTGLSVLLGTEPLVNTFVSRQEVSFADSAGASALEVAGLDATTLMNVEETVEPWPDQADSAIARALFLRYALVPHVQETFQPVLAEEEGTTIQRGTDIRFLRALADRNGFDCYVEPSPVPGVDAGVFAPRTLDGLPDAVLSVGFGVHTNVSEFRLAYDLSRPAAAATTGLDARSKTLQPVRADVVAERALGRAGTLERESPRPLVRPAGTGLARAPELARAVQALVDRSAWAIVATGRTGIDVAPLRPGGLVAVRGCGDEHNGSYLVTRVRHVIGRDVYEQRFEARRNAVGMTGTELFP
jgi:hypothetical protein